MATAFSHYSQVNPVQQHIHSAQMNVVPVAAPTGNQTLERESYRGELSYLRQQSSQMSSMIDIMPTGMILLDGDGIVVKINKVAKQLLDEPILGQPWFDVIRRSFKPREDDWHEVSLKDGRRVKLEITPLTDQPGQLIVMTDLTETRLLQDKLSQMQRLSMMGQTVAKLAHQIRTPLSAAMLYGANLKAKALSLVAREKFQDKLMAQLSQLEQQVNDMLLFSKSGTEQVVEPTSVNEVINDSTATMEALIQKADAKVNVSLCESDCQILANKNALAGAIQNLVHNSLAVIKQDAVINIRAFCKARHAYISVQDNGPGIPENIKDKIFEPFFTSRSQGTGLGLSVVKSVVDAHQGEAMLLNSSEKGAHFCIKLPLLDELTKAQQTA